MTYLQIGSKEINFVYFATSMIIAFSLILGINFGISKRSCLIFIYTFRIIPGVYSYQHVCAFIQHDLHIFCKKDIQFCPVPFNFDYNVFSLSCTMFSRTCPMNFFVISSMISKFKKLLLPIINIFSSLKNYN